MISNMQLLHLSLPIALRLYINSRKPMLCYVKIYTDMITDIDSRYRSCVIDNTDNCSNCIFLIITHQVDMLSNYIYITYIINYLSIVLYIEIP